MPVTRTDCMYAICECDGLLVVRPLTMPYQLRFDGNCQLSKPLFGILNLADISTSEKTII